MPRRAGRREGAGDREQGDALAGENIRRWWSACGPSAVAMASGTSGRRSPTWMVIRSLLRVRVKRQIGSAYQPPQALPVARSAAHCRGRWLNSRVSFPASCCSQCPAWPIPRFERAVIAMCVHDENGAIGIGIGHKRAGISFRGLLQQLDIDPGEAPDCAVHHGGPVEPGRGFVLHSTRLGRAGHASRQRRQRRDLRDDRDDRRASRDRRGTRARRSGSSRSAMPAGARASSTRR